MRITSIDVWQVVVPILPRVVNSPEYPDEALDHFHEIPKHIIRLHASDGTVGVGETTRGVPPAAVEQCAREVIDLEPDKLPLMQLPLPRNSAYDAFEMALIDLLGRARGVPAWVLLGGLYHDRIPVDWWMGLTTPERTAERAKEGLSRGFHGVKLKAKLELPNVERVAAIKEVAPDWTVVIDPNERFYRPSGALELARNLSGLGGVMFESPVPQRRLDWYQRLRDTLGLPLALHLGTIADLVPALEMGCADVYNLNGSMTEFITSTRAAHAAGCPVWHGSGVDLGIRDASFTHACAATPADLVPGDIIGNFLREDDLLEEPLVVEGGYVQVPTGPGLGVELDVAAVERYAVQES